MAIPGEPNSTRYKTQMILRHAWQRRAKVEATPSKAMPSQSTLGKAMPSEPDEQSRAKLT